MSIQIVPQDELADGKKTAGNIPPVLFANLKTLYQRRADRLRQLAQKLAVERVQGIGSVQGDRSDLVVYFDDNRLIGHDFGLPSVGIVAQP